MSWAPIVLADDVWLGARVVVLAGTNIGEGAVVAAASVVSGEVPEYAIMRGNPAVQVGERRSKDHA